MRRLLDAARAAERAVNRASARAGPCVGAHRVMSAVIAEMVASCERYATAHAMVRHAPIGCDVVRGPVLLDVLRGLVVLASDAELADRVSEIISLHALDLEE